MRKEYTLGLGVSALVALGLGIGFISKPGDRELGLMNLQDKKYHHALEIYEKRYTQGDHSIAVVMPLSKLYLQYGDVNKSIEVMEAFAKENPENVSAKRELGTLYQYAQRPDKYLKTIEAINRIAPTPENLHILSNIYNFNGQYDKQLAALNTLLDEKKALPNDMMTLAYLYVNRQDFTNAVRVVHAIPLEMFGTMPADMAQFFAGVLCDAGKNGEALAFAKNYVNVSSKRDSTNYSGVVVLASLFQNKGDTKAALSLLEPLKSQMQTQPQLLAEYAAAQMIDGNTDESFQLLYNLFKQHRLDTQTLDSFVEMVLFRKAYTLLPEVIEAVDVKALSHRRLVDLVEISLELHNYALVSRIADKLGVDYLQEDEVLATVFAIAEEGDPKQEIRHFETGDQLTFARIYTKAEEKEKALAVIKGINPKTLDEDMDPTELVLLCVELKAPVLCQEFLGNVSGTYNMKHKSSMEQAEMLLHTALGNDKVVLDWLGRGKNYNLVFMEMLRFTATNYKQPEIALFAAQYLYDKRPSPTNQIGLAEALILNHRPQEALDSMRILMNTNNEAVYPYVHALLGAMEKDATFKEEMQDFIQGDRFKSLDNDYKRDVAFLLLEYNQKPLAEPLFFALAQHASPNSPDVAQMLYLWGPMPPEYAQKWMMARARASSGAEQLAWLGHMGDVGMNDAVIMLSEKTQKKHNDAYIEALLYKKDYDAVGKIIQTEFAHTKDPTHIRKLVNYALQANLPELAEMGYQKIHASAPDDYQTLKELAHIIYTQARYTEAIGYVKAYLLHDPNDYLMQYYYAEIQNRAKHYEDAMQHYKKVAEVIVATQPKDTKMQLTYAVTLYRLGKTKQSFEQFRAMLAKEPHNTEIRESFANLLIEGGRYSEAEEVLSGKDHT